MTSDATDFEGESTPVSPEVTAVDTLKLDITSNEPVTFTVPATVTIAFNGYPTSSGNTMNAPATVTMKPSFNEDDCYFDVNGHCAKCGY